MTRCLGTARTLRGLRLRALSENSLIFADRSGRTGSRTCSHSAARGNHSGGDDQTVSRALPRRRLTVSRPVGGVLCLPCGSGGHPSERPTWGLPLSGRTGRPCPTLGLAPGGVCRAGRVAPAAGALLPHRFTLTCAGEPVIGGLFSVALSCGSPRLAASQHPALRSPDLPRPDPASGPDRGHPAGSPSPSV